jgi:hypothetical protein
MNLIQETKKRKNRTRAHPVIDGSQGFFQTKSSNKTLITISPETTIIDLIRARKFLQRILQPRIAKKSSIEHKFPLTSVSSSAMSTEFHLDSRRRKSAAVEERLAELFENYKSRVRKEAARAANFEKQKKKKGKRQFQ